MGSSSARYLSPQPQWAFLHIFGDESTKPALAELVSLLLPDLQETQPQDIKATYDQLYWELIKLFHFEKQEHELISQHDKWCYLLSRLPEFDRLPPSLREPIFEQVANRADRSHLTFTETESYEWSRLNYLGVRAAYITAYDHGAQKYTQNEKERIAPELHKIGMPVEQIAAVTQLPLERVLAIVAGFERKISSKQ